jgi:hypothetical protein
MSDIAIVKLFKDMFGKIFGTEEKSEKVTLVSDIEDTSEKSKTVAKEVSGKVKKTPAKKKEIASEKNSTPKKKTPGSKKKTVAKNIVEKKTVDKKETKRSSEKKKTKIAPKGTKKSEKLALYSKAFKKLYGEVDEDFLEIIVKNLGPSIYKKDAELVSCSDPKELDTVRKNFLMKKLGLEEDKEVLDAAIKEVCEELKESSKKYRALFYYRLAQKFKKESVLS